MREAGIFEWKWTLSWRNGVFNWSGLHLDGNLCCASPALPPSLHPHLLLLLLSKEAKEEAAIDGYKKHVTEVTKKQSTGRPPSARPWRGGASFGNDPTLRSILLHLQPKTPPSQKWSPRPTRLPRVESCQCQRSFHISPVPHVRWVFQVTPQSLNANHI